MDVSNRPDGSYRIFAWCICRRVMRFDQTHHCSVVVDPGALWTLAGLCGLGVNRWKLTQSNRGERRQWLTRLQRTRPHWLKIWSRPIVQSGCIIAPGVLLSTLHLDYSKQFFERKWESPCLVHWFLLRRSQKPVFWHLKYIGLGLVLGTMGNPEWFSGFFRRSCTNWGSIIL